jgi:SGNH hydrolase-like domain, acetyltransferase AlgX
MITVRRRRPTKTGEVSDPHGEVPDSPESQAPIYEGCLQGVGNGHALGWCWEPATPNGRVQVAIAVDGEIVAEGPADIARPDLTEHGDGAHGFLIALPDSLKAPGRHRVLALAGPSKDPIVTASSFWNESGNGWSDVVFEAAQPRPGGALSATVPKPPAPPDRRAVSLAGWLFDAREFEPSPAPAHTDLDVIVTSLTTTAATCAALGISYLPAIIPAKRRVVGVAPPPDRSWITELNTHLRDVDEVELLDLLPVLRDADRHGPTYNLTDADWNDRGAFFVARALLKDAHKRVPALRPGALADLHLRPVPGYRGTLADAPKLELVDDELVQCELDLEAEDGIVIDPHKLHALRMPVEAHLAQAGSTHLRVYETAEDKDAHIAVVGDSASLPLVLWLAERTRRTTFFWSDALPLTQLELELPYVVFHLIREADLLDIALMPARVADSNL